MCIGISALTLAIRELRSVEGEGSIWYNTIKTKHKKPPAEELGGNAFFIEGVVTVMVTESMRSIHHET